MNNTFTDILIASFKNGACYVHTPMNNFVKAEQDWAKYREEGTGNRIEGKKVDKQKNGGLKKFNFLRKGLKNNFSRCFQLPTPLLHGPTLGPLEPPRGHLWGEHKWGEWYESDHAPIDAPIEKSNILLTFCQKKDSEFDAICSRLEALTEPGHETAVALTWAWAIPFFFARPCPPPVEVVWGAGPGL